MNRVKLERKKEESLEYIKTSIKKKLFTYGNMDYTEVTVFVDEMIDCDLSLLYAQGVSHGAQQLRDYVRGWLFKD